MTPAWALRQEALLSDCIVSPNVFNHMVGRLCDFVAPYQQALETKAGQRNVHLYLAGLLSHLHRKNAETIATLQHARMHFVLVLYFSEFSEPEKDLGRSTGKVPGECKIPTVAWQRARCPNETGLTAGQYP